MVFVLNINSFQTKYCLEISLPQIIFGCINKSLINKRDDSCKTAV